MRPVSKIQFVAATLCVLAFAYGEAWGQSLVKVTVQDNGSLFQDAVVAVPEKVNAGMVMLKVTNRSKHSKHGIVVIPMQAGQTALSIPDGRSSDHDYVRNSAGYIAEILPGASSEMTLDLARGTYIVTANLRGPYLFGMWTALNVE